MRCDVRKHIDEATRIARMIVDIAIAQMETEINH